MRGALRRSANSRVKILFHFDASELLANKARTLAAPFEVACCPESSDTEFDAEIATTEVLWHSLKPVTAQVIARAPALRLIQKIGTGVNTIDLDAAKERGIAVCNLPGANGRAVAEMALLLMLACLRRLRDLDASVRVAGGWHAANGLQDRLGEIGGRTVGLVGYGAVPRQLAEWLTAMSDVWRLEMTAQSLSNTSADAPADTPADTTGAIFFAAFLAGGFFFADFAMFKPPGV